MDSLGDYMKKKHERSNSMLNLGAKKLPTDLATSVSKIQAMTAEMKSAVESLKKHRTPSSAKKVHPNIEQSDCRNVFIISCKTVCA